MKRPGLTISLIVEAESANYGEGFGNITTLKKITRSDGLMYTYISRQALRYNLINQLNWDDTPVLAEGGGDKKVIQFAPDASIRDYPEIDLFGYMKTTSGSNANTRSAVARLSNAISLEGYSGDTDFLTNMGLAKRIDENNSIAQSEIHKSLYSYTLTVDLDRVGIDEDVEIENDKKIDRIKKLLKAIQFLYRDIKGRRENLSPIFIIGGVYQRKNPFFANRLKMSNNLNLDCNIIKDVISLDEDIENNTKVGYLDGYFNNNKQIQDTLKTVSLNEFFKWLSSEVENAYGKSN
jgi:CRISPR-associated protein Cst2